MPTAPAPLRSRAPWLLIDTAVLTGRGLRIQFRQIDGLIMSVALPVLMLGMFVYVFGGAIDIGIDYVDYVVPGVIVSAAAFGATMTAAGVTQDVTTGTVDRLRSLSPSPAALLASHVIASLLRNLCSTAVVIGVALVMGFRPTASPVAWIAALGVIALFVTALAWVAVAFGLVARSVEAASGFMFGFVFLPYVSSAFVPPETLPSALRGFAEHQPITPVIDTVRSLLLGAPLGTSAWSAVAWCLGITALGGAASIVLFTRRMRR